MIQAPTTLEEAVENASELLKDGAETAMRMVMIGRRVKTED